MKYYDIWLLNIVIVGKYEKKENREKNENKIK